MVIAALDAHQLPAGAVPLLSRLGLGGGGARIAGREQDARRSLAGRRRELQLLGIPFPLWPSERRRRRRQQQPCLTQEGTASRCPLARSWALDGSFTAELEDKRIFFSMLLNKGHNIAAGGRHQ